MKNFYHFRFSPQRFVYFEGVAQVQADNRDDTPTGIEAQNKGKLPKAALPETLDGIKLPEVVETGAEKMDAKERATRATQHELAIGLSDQLDTTVADSERDHEAFELKITTLLDQMFSKDAQGKDPVSDQDSNKAKAYLVQIVKRENPDMDVQNFRIYESSDHPGTKSREGMVECSFRSEGVEKRAIINLNTKTVRDLSGPPSG